MINNSANRWIASLALFAIGTVAFPGIGSSTAIAQQTTRVWSDDSGSFSIEAKLLKINDLSVNLEKLNGVVIEVPFARLSKFDIEIVEKLKRKKTTTRVTKPANPETPTQTKSSPVSRLAVPPEIENPVSLQNTKRPRIRPDAEKRSTKKPNFDSNQLVSNLDNDNATQSNSFDWAVRSAETVSNRFTPPAKTSREVSSQEIEQLPEPYQSMAWQILDITNLQEIRAGLKALGSDWPRKKAPTLLKLVKRLARSPDAKTRKEVIDLLAIHDSDEGLKYVLAGIEDKNFFVRWACYEWIEKLGDERAIASLVRKLESDDPDLAAATLISFGNAAEPQILPLINHQSDVIQMNACSLLSKIGSAKSIATLESTVENATSIKVRMQASNALEQIKKRQNRSD